jgi:hypothetical protein
MPKRRLTKTHGSFNPAAVQRQTQALCDELLTLATAKGQPARKPQITPDRSGGPFRVRQ